MPKGKSGDRRSQASGVTMPRGSTAIPTATRFRNEEGSVKSEYPSHAPSIDGSTPSVSDKDYQRARRIARVFIERGQEIQNRIEARLAPLHAARAEAQIRERDAKRDVVTKRAELRSLIRENLASFARLSIFRALDGSLGDSTLGRIRNTIPQPILDNLKDRLIAGDRKALEARLPEYFARHDDAQTREQPLIDTFASPLVSPAKDRETPEQGPLYDPEYIPPASSSAESPTEPIATEEVRRQVLSQAMESLGAERFQALKTAAKSSLGAEMEAFAARRQSRKTTAALCEGRREVVMRAIAEGQPPGQKFGKPRGRPFNWTEGSDPDTTRFIDRTTGDILPTSWLDAAYKRPLIGRVSPEHLQSSFSGTKRGYTKVDPSDVEGNTRNPRANVVNLLPAPTLTSRIMPTFGGTSSRSWRQEQTRALRETGRGGWKRLRRRHAVHEVGHAMETQVPGLKEAQRAFLVARGGDPARPDTLKSAAFGYPYMRRAYGAPKSDTEGYEILSLGLEKVFEGPESPSDADISRVDPEAEAFVLGLLASHDPQKRKR